MWVDMFLVLLGTCLHWDTGNEYYFLTKVIQLSSSTSRLKFPYFLLLYAFGIIKGDLNGKLTIFTIWVTRKNFWSAFTLDLSLLMWSFWKISMHRQWINYFERDTWIILFSVVLKDVKIIFFLYNPRQKYMSLDYQFETKKK